MTLPILEFSYPWNDNNMRSDLTLYPLTEHMDVCAETWNSSKMDGDCVWWMLDQAHIEMLHAYLGRWLEQKRANDGAETGR